MFNESQILHYKREFLPLNSMRKSNDKKGLKFKVFCVVFHHLKYVKEKLVKKN